MGAVGAMRLPTVRAVGAVGAVEAVGAPALLLEGPDIAAKTSAASDSCMAFQCKQRNLDGPK